MEATEGLGRPNASAFDVLEGRLEPEFDYGDWFVLPDDATGMRSRGYEHRYLLLAEIDRLRANTKLRIRSSTRVEGMPHPAHAHGSPTPRCRLERDGRINMLEMVTVRTAYLDRQSYSCREPDIEFLRDVLKGRFR